MPDIRRFVTPIPPRSEQDAIVNYIHEETARIDALISRIREGIEKLKEYSTALISAAVTGKIDVRGEITPSDGTDL
jgi:restriction endonuclease S subunit